MQTAEQVQQLLEELKAQGASKAAIVEKIAVSCLGWPYVFGAIGEMCTPKNRDRRASASYPTIVTKCQVLSGKAKDCTGCEWGQGVRIFDCRGFTYWMLKQVDIKISTVGATTQYAEAAAWDMRGEIKGMPAGAVCCVFKDKNGTKTHTGMHIGNGQIIHCSGTVKRGKTSDSGWTHFGIPKGLYTDEELARLRETIPIHPTLRRGDIGEAVRQMQILLITAGYSVGTAGADGNFGSGTEAGVKAFQAASGLIADGICGPLTWNALDAAPRPQETYTVHIPGLDKVTAESFAAAYDGAYITKEG